jgi:hypothetical protein
VPAFAGFGLAALDHSLRRCLPASRGADTERTSMSIYPDREPRKRHEGHPIRAFLERHPTLLPNVCMLIALGVLIYMAADRLLY